VEDHQAIRRAIEEELADLGVAGEEGTVEGEGCVGGVEIEDVDAPAVLVTDEEEAAEAAGALQGLAGGWRDEARGGEMAIGDERETFGAGAAVEREVRARVVGADELDAPADGEVVEADDFFGLGEDLDEIGIEIRLREGFGVAEARPLGAAGVELAGAVPGVDNECRRRLLVLFQAPDLAGRVTRTVATEPEAVRDGVPEGAAEIVGEIVGDGAFDAREVRRLREGLGGPRQRRSG
jgi:hypothetical protein